MSESSFESINVFIKEEPIETRGWCFKDGKSAYADDAAYNTERKMRQDFQLCSEGKRTKRCIHIEVDELIACVKERPPLWNNTGSDYEDKLLKDRLWIEVADELFDDFGDKSSWEKDAIVKKTKTKWKNVKDYFMKYMNKRTNGDARKKYEYADSLSFLLTTLDHRDRQPMPGGYSLEDACIPEIVWDAEEPDSASEADPNRNIRVNVEDLIIHVKERQPLWNKFVSEFADKVVKDRLWLEVAELLFDDFAEQSRAEKDQTVKKIKTKWKNVKDYFSKYINRRRMDDAIKKYTYANALKFLLPTLDKRSATTGYMEVEENSVEAADEEGGQEKDSSSETEPNLKNIERSYEKFNPFQNGLSKAFNGDNATSSTLTPITPTPSTPITPFFKQENGLSKAFNGDNATSSTLTPITPITPFFKQENGLSKAFNGDNATSSTLTPITPTPSTPITPCFKQEDVDEHRSRVELKDTKKSIVNSFQNEFSKASKGDDIAPTPSTFFTPFLKIDVDGHHSGDESTTLKKAEFAELKVNSLKKELLKASKRDDTTPATPTSATLPTPFFKQEDNDGDRSGDEPIRKKAKFVELKVNSFKNGLLMASKDHTTPSTPTPKMKETKGDVTSSPTSTYTPLSVTTSTSFSRKNYEEQPIDEPKSKKSKLSKAKVNSFQKGLSKDHPSPPSLTPSTSTTSTSFSQEDYIYQSDKDEGSKVKKMKFSKAKLEPFQKELINVLKGISSAPAHLFQRQDSDADRSYILSVLHDYRKLSAAEKFQFQIHVSQFFLDIENKKNAISNDVNNRQYHHYPSSVPQYVPDLYDSAQYPITNIQYTASTQQTYAQPQSSQQYLQSFQNHSQSLQNRSQHFRNHSQSLQDHSQSLQNRSQSFRNHSQSLQNHLQSSQNPSQTSQFPRQHSQMSQNQSLFSTNRKQLSQNNFNRPTPSPSFTSVSSPSPTFSFISTQSDDE